MRRCYDPRDPAQSERDPSSWRLSDNPILVAAAEVSESVSAARIDWPAIAADADDFERQILKRDAGLPRAAPARAAARRSG